MAVDYGIRINIDAAVSGDAKAELVRKVLKVLASRTLVVTHAASYAAGTGTGNQVEIAVT